MEQKPKKFIPFAVTAVVALAAWAAWLGWDQHRDVRPDGSETGPYAVWQVVGLVLTVLVPLGRAALRRRVVGGSLGVSAGLTVAAAVDWSDDASGLFVIGVALVALGSLAAAFTAAGLIAAVARPRT